MTVVFKNDAEEWFARYLESEGYEFSYEADLGVPTRPDFLIRRKGESAICEVKSFEQVPKLEKRLATGQPSAISAEELYGPVRGAVREAARNLKPLDGSGTALVVVLANPMGHLIQL